MAKETVLRASDAPAQRGAWPVRRGRLPDPLRSTPALIVLHGVLLILTLLVTAVVAVRSSGPADNLGERAADVAVTTSSTASEIYQGLADADVAASAVFLLPPGADQHEKLRTDYDTAVHIVERQLTDAMGGAVNDPDRLNRLAAIGSRLTVYRGVVCAALATAGAPSGASPACPPAPAAAPAADPGSTARAVLASAYAREASHYMSTELLTEAQRLWDDDTRRLLHARADARPWVAASVLVPLALLGALVATQLWLRRRTRRRLNAGLLLASGAAVAVLAMLVASWWHWPAADDQFGDLETAIAAQNTSQQTLGDLLAGRADLYLALGASVDPAGHQADFYARGVCPDPQARTSSLDCPAINEVWTARQSKTQDAFSKAVNTVLRDGSIGQSFEEEKSNLKKALNADGDRADDALEQLPAAPRQFGGAAAWLTLLAGAGVVAGLRQRYLEYQ
ncbi:hypothetical protein JOD64_005579 [Micromonospora luteifusca]|uniref:Integral membrane protein n=1 Tax=Micromonospora luteifusca TaxID=709860 RepID=A0ABS2M1R9_9ACTN|nr:hypothetical protein [Micromonospora luteifusca]MBM7494357.1 hypothetical protein [Micromonospora luteifusca]